MRLGTRPYSVTVGGGMGGSYLLLEGSPSSLTASGRGYDARAPMLSSTGSINVPASLTGMPSARAQRRSSTE
jgi:hypothetical protein